MSQIPTQAISVIEQKGIASLVKGWSGLEVLFINGGPSVSDPVGEYDGYICFSGKDGKKVSLGFSEGRIVKLFTYGPILQENK